MRIALAGLLMLTACDGGGEPTKVKKIEVGDSGYLDRLRGLSQQNRDLALRRAVQDSGQSCPRVEGSQETGTYENLTTFTVRCEGDRNWAVFIAPTGDIQVRSCAHVEQLGLPACRTDDQSAGSSSTKS
jgi:hypothetical protein